MRLSERLSLLQQWMTTFVLLIVIVTVLSAQEPEKKEAAKKEVDLQNVQTPKANAPLPKIDLPEFVITGNEKIDLNIETKNEDDQDRIFSPAIPALSERSMNVGEALTPKQVKTFTKTPSAMNGKVFAGFGFYGTPQFNGWFGQYDPASSFVLNGYYSESNGHLPDAGFWKGGFGLRGSYTLPDSLSLLPLGQLSGELKYGREAYRAYGSSSPFRVRDLSGIEVSGGIGSRYALPYKSMSGVDYSARIGGGFFSTGDIVKSSETEFFVSGNATTKILETAFRASVEYRISGYTMALPGVQSGHWFVFRTDGRQMILPLLQLSFSIQQIFYRGNVGPANGRLYPSIDLRYAFTEQASMYAGFAPTVERNSLSSLFKENRYSNAIATVVPTDIRVHAYMGMEFSPIEEVIVTARGSYKHLNNYATFYDKDSAKVWEVLYLSGIRSTKFDLSALYRLNEKQNVTAYATVQSVQQKDSTKMLPHLPKYIIGSVYHHFFDIGVHAEAFVEYHSFRYTDFLSTNKNPGYLTSGIKAEIEMFNQFRGYTEINNLFDQRYYIWNGYQERTIFVMLGISYHW